MTTSGDAFDWRGLSASLASVVAIIGLGLTVGNEWYILGLPIGLLCVAAIAIHRAKLGPQIFARAVWWANLALGVALAASHGHREAEGGLVFATACGAALLLAGRRRLATASAAAGYAPVALRSMLLLLMVFALADAQTFVLFGIIHLIERNADKVGEPIVMIPIGLTYVVGFVGLYRLQLWGALVNVVLSLLVLVLLFTTSLMPMDGLKVFIAVLAVVHVITATPVTLAALAGKELPGLSPNVRGVGATVVTVGLMLLAIGCFAVNR